MTLPAYFITFTTYGTRPSGDERGWVHRDRNTPRTPVEEHDPRIYRHVQGLMRWPPLLLSEEMRDVVADTIEDHAKFRRWLLHAMNVRTNHVHVVVTAVDRSPEKVMGELKLWCSRRLRERGLVDIERSVWTEHGSTIWINDVPTLREKVRYVLDGQGVDFGTTNV